MTDWIELFIEDRNSMTKIMRENAAADLLARYSIAPIAKQMIMIEEYEKETESLLAKFREDENGQQLAHRHLKKVGAIA